MSSCKCIVCFWWIDSKKTNRPVRKKQFIGYRLDIAYICLKYNYMTQNSNQNHLKIYIYLSFVFRFNNAYKYIKKRCTIVSHLFYSFALSIYLPLSICNIVNLIVFNFLYTKTKVFKNDAYNLNVFSRWQPLMINDCLKYSVISRKDNIITMTKNEGESYLT